MNGGARDGAQWHTEVMNGRKKRNTLLRRLALQLRSG